MERLCKTELMVSVQLKPKAISAIQEISKMSENQIVGSGAMKNAQDTDNCQYNP
jgi:hypothetical protein